MRITKNMMISNTIRSLQTNIRRLDKTQMRYDTGKRIHKPSDDPVGITRSLKVRADISELQQYKKNVEDATSWLENSEQAMISNQEALKRIRDLMVQGANGVLTTEETIKVQTEIEQLKNQIISQANTTYSGDYIFSGKNTDKKLLNSDGTYNAEVKQFLDPTIVDHRINYGVGAGEYIPINTVGTSFLEATDLTMDVKLPTVAGDEGATRTEFLGAEIKVTGVSDPTDPDAPLEYNLDINIEGIGEITVEGLESEEDIYEQIKNIFANIDSFDENYASNPNPSVTQFTPDPDADTSITPKEAWNKLLIKKDIPADINNLTFGTYTNKNEGTDKIVGIVAQPQKAGLINLIERIEKNLMEGKHEEVSELLGSVDRYLDQLSVVRGEIGAKVNRTELILNRIEDDVINLRALQSKLEDADLAETAIQLMNEENVYRASLAVGARIIQPTLLDFLR